MSQRQTAGRQDFQMDYVDVAARIVEFREKYPDGRLRPADLSSPYRIETLDGQTHIVVVAAAYRSADDPLPGIGMAYEVFPGRTPYTRGSELQNAETSAWGRAIVAALAADTKRGIASAEEVRNRQAERGQEAEDRQQARSATRRLQAAASVPAQGRQEQQSPHPAAVAVAELAAKCNDADKLLGTYREAEGRNMLGAVITGVVHADLLDKVGLEPGKALALGDWLKAAGLFVRDSGGLSVQDAVNADASAPATA